MSVVFQSVSTLFCECSLTSFIKQGQTKATAAAPGKHNTINIVSVHWLSDVYFTQVFHTGFLIRYFEFQVFWLLLSHIVFHLLYSREVCNFRCSPYKWSPLKSLTIIGRIILQIRNHTEDTGCQMSSMHSLYISRETNIYIYILS